VAEVDVGVAMNTASGRRVTTALALGGGVVALVGNALAPRLNGDDVVVYRRIAHSDRYAVAAVIVLVALILVTASLVGLGRIAAADGQPQLAEYARLAAVVGGAIAVAESALQIYGYRQQARAFDGANAHNVVTAFWATNALDHATSALFAIATVLLLGLAPLLLGVAQLRERTGGRLGLAAVIGGAVCVVVGFGELLKADQSSYDVPFAVGSVIVTLWLLATAFVIRRQPAAALPTSREPSRL
jgi:hypothetical protein